jgi:DNA-binding response OmpR family regulator
VERLRILVLEDNPADLRLLAEMLAEAGENFDIVWESRLAKGLARLRSDRFDALLLDLGLPDSQGFQTFRRVRAEAPDLPVLLLTGLEDNDLALRAVQDGAQDYIVKGRLDPAALARSVRFAVERRTRESPGATHGRIVAIAGAKGGVGCTTVALNVAALLAAQKQTVTAVELRPDCGSFSSHLKQGSSAGFSLDNPQFIRVRAGFDAVFGPQLPEECGEIPAAAADQLMRRIARRGGIAVVDLPPNTPAWAEPVFRAASVSVIVTEADDASLDAAKLAATSLRRWTGRLGALVVHRALLADLPPVPDIEAALGCEMFGALPSAPDACLAAQRAGLPLAVLRPHSALVQALAAITQKLALRAVA